jgi:ribose/xylose/arabinose/galactoside ABC-type transport system permease subunit
VHTGLVAAVVTAALLAAVAGVVVAVRDRPPGRVTLALAAAGSLLTVGQSVAAAVDLVQGRRPPETATYIGYLVGIVVVLPLALTWALAERTRWSGLVVAVGGFTVAIMTARLVMLSRGAGA